MPRNWALFGVCAVLFAFAAGVHSEDETKPVVSLSPLTGEQLAVYRAILTSWAGDETSQLDLADRTVPSDDTSPFHDKDCGKGLDLEPASPTLVHHFRVADLSQLGSRNIRLVGTERGDKDVQENDPGHAIRNGGSIDDAVRNGIAHGLFTLSEIRFDKTHTHAVVAYSFVCGELCGNGATLILERTKTGWLPTKNRCSQWISRALAPSHTPEARPA
jgi:hypothetical protein